MRRSAAGSWIFVVATLAFLFVPVALVVVFSFNAGNSASLPFKGFSLKWYDSIFADPVIVDALKNTLLAGLGTVGVVVPLGAGAALVISRREGRVMSGITALLAAPLLLPGLFIGIALLAYFSRIGASLSIATVIAGHSLVTLPFVVVIVSARLAGLDVSIEEAARDLGASRAQTFRKIVLPLIAPALVGAALLVIAWSVDEFVITLFVNGGTTTVPVYIFGQLRRGVDPAINAIASLILATTTLAAFLAGRHVSVRDLAR